MRALLVLAFLGWLMSQPWAALIGLALIVIAIVVMWLFSVSTERRGISNWSGRNTIDSNYVAALETMVAEAETEVATLHTEIERLRSAAVAASEPDPKAVLYRRVGLAPNAPNWLISAARRAFRAALHPDRHPPAVKAEAERRFQLAENVFDEIASLRP